MNFYENAEDMVDELYRLYPEMDSYNTQERTEAASQLLTDFGFASQAYNEAHNHATYLCLFSPVKVCRYQYIQTIIILITHHMPRHWYRCKKISILYFQTFGFDWKAHVVLRVSVPTVVPSVWVLGQRIPHWRLLHGVWGTVLEDAQGHDHKRGVGRQWRNNDA